MSIYEGNEKYIFVSYAHRDSGVVIPMIDALQSSGFRVWYDQGIEAGTEWPAYIEDRLNCCEVVLICMSPAAVDSVNCRNEINYASMLKKELFVVYLEETVLAQGMNLQLNSKQSLFRHRHPSDESFLGELVRARILQGCREGAPIEPEPIHTPSNTSHTSTPHGNFSQGGHSQGGFFQSGMSQGGFSQRPAQVIDDGSRAATIQAHLMGENVIARAGSIGSNMPSNPWPKGEYSQTISTESFNTVHFHCSLLRPEARSVTRRVGIRIYDSRDVLVHEDISNMQFNPGNDRFSLGWIIREKSGLMQTPGTYTALFWIDDSRVFEYTFSLSARKSTPSADTVKEAEKLKKRLGYPKLLLLHILTFISFMMVGMGSSANNDGMLGIGIILLIVFYIAFFRNSRKIAVKNWFLTLILTIPLFFHYGLFIFIMSIVTLCNRSKWKSRLAELQMQL